MYGDENNFIEKIIAANKESEEAPNGFMPDLLIGQVTNVSPLEITINSYSKPMVIENDELSLSSLVQDHTVDCWITYDAITDEGACSSGGPHKHKISGTQKNHKITLLYGLKTGESVYLMRCSDGQHFFVLDRCRDR